MLDLVLRMGDVVLIYSECNLLAQLYQSDSLQCL